MRVTAAGDSVAKSMPKDYRVSITDAAGDAAYPLSTFTWLLVYEKNRGDRGALLKDFLRWMLKDGQGMTSELGDAPLPASVAARVAKTVESIK